MNSRPTASLSILACLTACTALLAAMPASCQQPAPRATGANASTSNGAGVLPATGSSGAPAPASAGSGASSGSGKQSEWRERWIKEYWAKEEERQRKLHAAVRASSVRPASVQAARPNGSTPNNAAATNHGSATQNSTPPVSAAPQTQGRPIQQSAPNPAETGVAVLHRPASSGGDHPANLASTAKAPLQTPVGQQNFNVVAKPSAGSHPGVAATSSPSQRPASNSSVANAKPASKPSDLNLSQTKPDIITPPAPTDHTIESPLQAVGDGWRMIAYLLPTLIFVLVGLNVLRRYQQRSGRLPGVIRSAAVPTERRPAGGLMGALSGLFSEAGKDSRSGGGSGMRLVESLNVGATTLHLVQVRGRTLLITGGTTGVSVLTEFAAPEAAESEEFRHMLQSAAADLDGLDIQDSEYSVSAVVGSLEDVMRSTGGSLERRVRRLRTVRETEDGDRS